MPLAAFTWSRSYRPCKSSEPRRQQVIGPGLSAAVEVSHELGACNPVNHNVTRMRVPKTQALGPVHAKRPRKLVEDSRPPQYQSGSIAWDRIGKVIQ